MMRQLRNRRLICRGVAEVEAGSGQAHLAAHQVGGVVETGQASDDLDRVLVQVERGDRTVDHLRAHVHGRANGLPTRGTVGGLLAK